MSDEKKYACSTMWNIRQHKNPVDALKEIKEMGFDYVELNYLVTKEMVQEMMPYLSKGILSVSSVHNVFPKALDKDYGTDSLLLGYLDEEKRKEAVRLTKISIDYAAIFQAEACVIHPSEVPVSRNFDRELKESYKKFVRGQDFSEKEQLSDTLQQFLVEKKKVVEKHLSQTLKSLDELSEYVAQKNYAVKIAIENRAMVHQLPTFLEAKWIFNQLKDAPVYLWYDTGHAIMMEELGLLEMMPILQELTPRIAGAHIHDARHAEDHFTPYTFGEDFDRYIPILKEIGIIVFEVGPKCSKEEMIKSFEKVKQKLANTVSSY